MRNDTARILLLLTSAAKALPDWGNGFSCSEEDLRVFIHILNVLNNREANSNYSVHSVTELTYDYVGKRANLYLSLLPDRCETCRLVQLAMPFILTFSYFSRVYNLTIHLPSFKKDAKYFVIKLTALESYTEYPSVSWQLEICLLLSVCSNLKICPLTKGIKRCL